jgi:hypothetical protein
MIRREESRGQTIPFYVIAVIMSLALSLFVMNYTNTIRWHIRAQNAADAAALAMVAGDANVANQIAQAQYAAAVSEYRIRSIIYSMINAANGVGTDPTQTDFCGDNHRCAGGKGTPTSTNTCDPSDATGGIGDDTGVACDDAYDQEPAVYDKAVQQYANAVAALAKLQTNTTVPGLSQYTGPGPAPSPGASAPPGSAAGAAFSYIANQKSCWDQDHGGKGIFDCDFFYTDDLTLASPPWLNKGANEIVMVTTCRTVTSAAPHFISPLVPTTFNAEATSAATLAAIPETFSPGDATKNPDPNNNNNAYAPPENFPPVAGSCSNPVTPQNDKCDGWMASRAYTQDDTPLSISVTFYQPALTRPPKFVNGNCERG